MEWTPEETPLGSQGRRGQCPQQQIEHLGLFSLCHNGLESYWHLVNGGRTVPRREELACVPTGLSNRRNVKYLDIQVGEKPGYHYLNLDPKPILYKNTEELMHGFRNL